MKRAVFPGSFDPFTRGHEYIVRKGSTLFDEVIIAIGTNTSKNSTFSLADRVAMVQTLFKDQPNIKVMELKGLTVDFCKEVDAMFILRGLRDEKDFSYEKSIAIMNGCMKPTLQTVFLLTAPELAGISSTILREILRNKGDIKPFLPEGMPFVYPHS